MSFPASMVAKRCHQVVSHGRPAHELLIYQCQIVRDLAPLSMSKEIAHSFDTSKTFQSRALLAKVGDCARKAR